jgi:hypothetical protein
LQYQAYDCEQVHGELLQVNRHVTEVTGEQKTNADRNAVTLGVGLVLFWPALFFLAGGDKSEELGRLKGEYDALEQIAALVVGFGRVRHDVGECGLRDLARECAPGAQREREGGLALRPRPQHLDERDRVLEAFL